MSQKKDAEDCQSEEASSQAESYDANKSGTSETYDTKDFCPGIRIEAKDFDGKWYPAKVSDVDWTENEILVHFENWNTKFDEWIPMDSSRLRSLQKPSIPHKKEHVKFSKGEEVMAMWSPYQKYPATIQAVLPNDRYDVLFYDGFLKRLKSHKILKLENGTKRTEVPNFTDIGTKEERRERKRKINVAELFHINKRSKKKGLVHSKSQDIKTYPVTKSKNRNSTLEKPGNVSLENNVSGSGAESKEVRPKDEKLSTSGNTVSTKALVDTIPAAFEVKYINGQTEMWSKQLYQRSEGRTAGKLDIVILNPQGRKFRSRNEIMKYCEENGIMYSHEAFDFSAKGRPKSKPNLQALTNKIEHNNEDKDKLSLRKGQKRPYLEVSMPASQSNSPVTSADVLPPSEIATDPNKVFIGDFEVVIENGKFICPVKTCAKHFRRENLLHMHMKHYHPEFSKYLDYTPSVTDLAYARTVGGHDAAEVSSPALRKSEKLEKAYNKIDNFRKAIDTSFEYGKEVKKIKLSDSKSEPKIYSAKGFNESSLSTTDFGDFSVDGSQKTSHSIVKNASNLNDFAFKSELSNLDKNGTTSLDVKSTEINVPDSKSSSIASNSLMKSLRHKLNNRKKASRFQGSFAEHMRKKKLISQDQSKSQSKMNRHQNSQHLRQQLQQSPSLSSSSMPAQSFVVDDLNANATSPSHTIPRYPKPPLSLMNEMSGKNHLLTSSLSPATADITNQQGHESKVKENKGSNDRSEKAKTECNRRSFLTGLINARKRRATMTYRVRKKRKRAIKEERIRALGFTREPSAGLSQVVTEKADEIALDCGEQNTEVKTSQENDESEKGSKDLFKKSLRLKLKRIDANTSKWVQGHNSEFVRPNKYEMESGVTQTSINGTDDMEEAKVVEELESKAEHDGTTSAEFPEIPSAKKINVKESIDSSSLPKSYVLLENVCRKEVYGKYCNVSRRGNDENIGERQRNEGAKPKANRRGKKDERRVLGKRVRFEKTVLKKWIPMEEGTQERVVESEGGEGRRDDRKRKSAKGQLLDDHPMRERETIVQVHKSDDVARDDTLPQINSGLDFKFDMVRMTVG